MIRFYFRLPWVVVSGNTDVAITVSLRKQLGVEGVRDHQARAKKHDKQYRCSLVSYLISRCWRCKPGSNKIARLKNVTRSPEQSAQELSPSHNRRFRCRYRDFHLLSDLEMNHLLLDDTLDSFPNQINLSKLSNLQSFPNRFFIFYNMQSHLLKQV
jgi:hypothetical protein